MTVLDQAGSAISGLGWGSIGIIVTTIAVIMGMLLLVGAVALFLWWKTFDISVKIYAPFGQINLTEQEIKKMQIEAKYNKQDTIKAKNLKFDMIKFKRTHGKYVTKKGASYFSTFIPLRKHEPVPMELLFNDGVHMLRLAKDVYIPIPRPEFVIGVSEKTILSVKDNNDWRLFNNMMAERINMRYTPAAEAKRMTAYFVIGIIAIVLIGGFLLYLLYSAGNRSSEVAQQLTGLLKEWTRQAVPK